MIRLESVMDFTESRFWSIYVQIQPGLEFTYASCVRPRRSWAAPVGQLRVLSQPPDLVEI